MNRIARAASIEGMSLITWSIDAESLEVDAADESVGTYVPPSRNALIFDIRSSDDADGDRRMMGSGRLEAALGLCANVGLLGRFAAAACAALRALNGAASFRTWEKS